MNPRLLWLLVALLAPAIPLGAQALSPVRVDALTTEHFVNPVGLGDAVPRLSWKLRSDRPGEVQTAYEIHASSAPFTPAMTGDLWESGKVASDQSILVPWGGKAARLAGAGFLGRAGLGPRWRGVRMERTGLL